MWKFLLFPRGILAIILYTFWIAIPLSIIQSILGLQKSPKSWNVTLNIYAHVVRFIMAGGDWRTVRDLTMLYDLFDNFRVWIKGGRMEHVKRLVHDQVVNGDWIVTSGDIIPSVGSKEWDHRLVCFWAHGGGFGAGSSVTHASAHIEVMNQFKKLSIARKPLIYFSVQYPLAPEAKYPKQLDSALSAYYWLINHVGVRHIVLGGDSSGATLALSLYNLLVKEKAHNPSLIMPKSIMLISPWLDLSLSHTPPDIIGNLTKTSDYMSYRMLEKWRDNVTPHGMNPRDPSISPFFDLNPLQMPEDGILLIYGSTEVFAPVVDDWVKSIRKQKEARTNLKIILGVDMPHNFPLALYQFPTGAKEKAERALFEIAKFYFKSNV